LLAVRVDEQHFSGSDSIVRTVLVLVRYSGYAASLLGYSPLFKHETKDGRSGSNARPRGRSTRTHWTPEGDGGRVGVVTPLPLFGFLST
jgi:hypothetical protein